MAVTEADRKYLRLSLAAEQTSHDPNRQVGALLVSKCGSVLASASNQPPEQLRLSYEESQAFISEDPEWKYYVLEHAERNAINIALRKKLDLSGATMYATLFPCADCARAIVSANITQLVVLGLRGISNRDNKWLNHYKYAEKILHLAGVEVRVFPVDQLTGNETA